MSRYDAYNINQELQGILTEIRIKSGLTQIDVAKRLNKPQSFVSKYETGERRLSVGDFILVCAAIETKPSKVLNKLQK